MRASFTQAIELKFWDLVIPTISRSRLIQNGMKMVYPYLREIPPKVLIIGVGSAAGAGILLGLLFALVAPIP